MKRVTAFLLAFVLLLCTACGGTGGSSKDTVPDSLVQSVYDGAFSSRLAGNFVYSEIFHDPDVDAHTDTVTVKVRSEVEFGEVEHWSTAVFQYSRESDTWNCIRQDDIAGEVFYLDKDKLVGATYYGVYSGYYTGYKAMFNYYLEITDIDLETGYVTVTYEVENDYENNKVDFYLCDSGTFELENRGDRTYCDAEGCEYIAPVFVIPIGYIETKEWGNYISHYYEMVIFLLDDGLSGRFIRSD